MGSSTAVKRDNRRNQTVPESKDPESKDKVLLRERRQRTMPKTKVQLCYATRTDGTPYYDLGGEEEFANEPDLQDPTPAADGSVNYYRKVGKDEDLHIEWRWTLGIKMMEIAGRLQAGGTHMLAEFPPEYVLWLHVKSKPQVSAKGSNQVQVNRYDTYLFGHPNGKTKKYKTPMEFLPHLLWLSTDSTGNYDNCGCKICSPDKRKPKELKSEPPATTTAAAGPAAQRPQGTLQPAPLQPAAPQPTTSQPTADKSTRPTPPGPEQKADANANCPFLYRPGELVWFNRGTSWGLSVICMRQHKDRAQYLVQPLSHPLNSPPSAIKDEALLKPWLAWSVPLTTLLELRGLTFDEVKWEDFAGKGSLEVDGSILAAKKIDGSYTFFERHELPTAVQGEARFNGMFLGGEKVWVGEPVRLKADTNEADPFVVMVIQQMIENDSAGYVHFIGDIYRFVSMPNPYKDPSEWPVSELPARMVRDLNFRNGVAHKAKINKWYEWRLLEPNAKRGLGDIKGRWYQSETLLPLLLGPVEFQAEVVKGQISDASLWMNSKGVSSDTAGGRKLNRLDTLGKSAPAGLKISRGLNGRASENVFPDEQSTESDMDQYLNLEQGV